MVPCFTGSSLIKRNELLDHDWVLLTGCREPDALTCAMRIQDRTTQVSRRRSFTG